MRIPWYRLMVVDQYLFISVSLSLMSITPGLSLEFVTQEMFYM